MKQDNNMVSKSSGQPGDSLIPFFLLTFMITWGFGAFAIFLPEQFKSLFGVLTDTNPIYFLVVAAPTISATLLVFLRDGWSGLGVLYARLVRWRFGVRWYALVLVGFPTLGWLATQITGASPLKNPGNLPQILWLLFTLLISGPLGEELGWRGFCLPRLLKRFNPFFASLILGVIWGIWHLPSFFLSGMVQHGLSLQIFIIFATCLSIIMTWFFRYTDGSVLIAVMIHYMVNFCLTIIGVPVPTMTAMLLVASILVLALDKSTAWFQSPNSEARLVGAVGIK